MPPAFACPVVAGCTGLRPRAVCKPRACKEGRPAGRRGQAVRSARRGAERGGARHRVGRKELNHAHPREDPWVAQPRGRRPMSKQCNAPWTWHQVRPGGSMHRAAYVCTRPEPGECRGADAICASTQAHAPGAGGLCAAAQSAAAKGPPSGGPRELAEASQTGHEHGGWQLVRPRSTSILLLPINLLPNFDPCALLSPSAALTTNAQVRRVPYNTHRTVAAHSPRHPVYNLRADPCARCGKGEAAQQQGQYIGHRWPLPLVERADTRARDAEGPYDPNRATWTAVAATQQPTVCPTG